MSHTQFSIFPESLNGTNLRHVADCSFDPKAEQQIVKAGGKLDAVDLFLAFQESQATIKTHDFATVFGSLSMSLLTGLACSNSSYFQYQKRSDGGFASGSNHNRLRSYKGFLHAVSIEANQDEKKPATLDLLYHFLADGSNNYAAMLAGQALSGTPDLDTYYTLGPLYIDGTQYDGNTKFRLDTGIQFKPSRVAGGLVAQQGCVHERGFKMNVEFRDLAPWVTHGMSLDGLVDVVQYLQKVDADGLRVAANVAEHIAITFPEAKLEPTKLSGGADDDTMSGYTIHAIQPDPAVAIASISLASTIP